MGGKTPGPTTVVIFGGTGDLARRKLLPALYRLETLKMLPEVFHVVGFATRKISNDEYAALAEESVAKFSNFKPVDKKTLKNLTGRVRFVSSNFESLDGYKELKTRLDEIDKGLKEPTSKLFYLATQPSFFRTIIEMLDRSGLSSAPEGGPGDNGTKPKIIIEKPFGRDLDSARALNELIYKYFDEEQVYRIDHYLGKETVQNILFFRFANGIYEPIWNRKYIDHVQITVAESIGIEGRGRYFEEAGILRDMVQNHILQLLALVAMEPPINMDAEFIRAKKIELFRSLRAIGPEDVREFIVRGQYGAGKAAGANGGEKLAAYTEEANVSPASTTETFAAMKVLVDNWRWSGVPFYIRTGKRLAKRLTEIAVVFKEVPLSLFTSCLTCNPHTNVLVLKIQPDEGINFRLNVKHPGSEDRMETVDMDFTYRESFDVELPEAYERLLLDAMLGDATLFPHKEGIEATWGFIDMIHKGWEKYPTEKVPLYGPGSWGPEEARELIEKDGRKWREP